MLAAVSVIAAMFAIYEAGYRAGELDALKVPLKHYQDRNLVQGQLRLLAADDRRPVPRCRVAFTLIGPDGGDGGFQSSASDTRGIVKIPAYLSPGRYQVSIECPGQSRYVHTEYASDEEYLLIRPDGSYSPYEYTVKVK